MVIVSFGTDFLKADNCKTGDICKILDEGSVSTIKTPEGELKKVINFSVQINNEDRIFTPNKTNGKLLEDIWGKNTKEWVGKCFEIELVKMLIFGKMQQTITINPLPNCNKLGKVAQEEVIEEVVL